MPPERRRELCEQISYFETSDRWYELAAATKIKWESLWNLFSIKATDQQRARRQESIRRGKTAAE